MTRLRASGLTGPRGLITALVARAAMDSLGAAGIANAIDAWAFLQGDLYREYLSWLDLPTDWWPAGIEEMSDDELFDLINGAGQHNPISDVEMFEIIESVEVIEI